MNIWDKLLNFDNLPTLRVTKAIERGKIET